MNTLKIMIYIIANKVEDSFRQGQMSAWPAVPAKPFQFLLTGFEVRPC